MRHASSLASLRKLLSQSLRVILVRLDLGERLRSHRVLVIDRLKLELLLIVVVMSTVHARFHVRVVRGIDGTLHGMVKQIILDLLPCANGQILHRFVLILTVVSMKGISVELRRTIMELRTISFSVSLLDGSLKFLGAVSLVRELLRSSGDCLMLRMGGEFLIDLGLRGHQLVEWLLNFIDGVVVCVRRDVSVPIMHGDSFSPYMVIAALMIKVILDELVCVAPTEGVFRPLRTDRHTCCGQMRHVYPRQLIWLVEVLLSVHIITVVVAIDVSVALSHDWVVMVIGVMAAILETV